MCERELERVEHLARGGVACEILQFLVLTIAVGAITYQRMSHMLEVDPDLVGAPGVDDGFDQGGRAQTFQHPVTGTGFAAEILADRHALAVGRVPRDGRPDFARIAGQFSTNDGLVNLVHLA